MRQFGATPSRTTATANKSDLLANLTPYSRNDVVWCGSQVVNVANKVLQSTDQGALVSMLKSKANAIVSAPEPTEAKMSDFIKELLTLFPQGSFGITAQEVQCMQSIFWLESEVLKSSLDKVVWSESNRIFVAPANATSANSESEFPWFVALGITAGLSTVLWIGYNIVKPKKLAFAN